MHHFTAAVMTGWEVLNKIIDNFPPVAITLLVIALGAIFAIGFAKYGLIFIKYGFSQKVPDSSLEKRFDTLEATIGNLRTEFKTELEIIKVNHFGHLKNYLTVLNSILLDKGIINNENKARLDNELRDM
jgi:hypothetical protein